VAHLQQNVSSVRAAELNVKAVTIIEEGRLLITFDSGVEKIYECGVLYRIKCWLDELGITHRFIPEIGKCHMHVNGSCAGEIKLFLSVKDRET